MGLSIGRGGREVHDLAHAAVRAVTSVPSPARTTVSYRVRVSFRDDRPDEFAYDVALSFAGEQRPYAEEVAKELHRRSRRVFYDSYESADLWGKNLYDHLGWVYGTAAQYCTLFASIDYAAKVWTTHERRSAQARSLTSASEYVLPVRFDDTEIPGLPSTIAYVDARKTSPAQVATLIIRKLDKSNENYSSHQSSSIDNTATSRVRQEPADSAGLGPEYGGFYAPLTMSQLAQIDRCHSALLLYTESAEFGVGELNAMRNFRKYVCTAAVRSRCGSANVAILFVNLGSLWRGLLWLGHQKRISEVANWLRVQGFTRDRTCHLLVRQEVVSAQRRTFTQWGDAAQSEREAELVSELLKKHGL